MDVEVDHMLKLVGGYRRYHLTIFVLLGLSTFIPLCYQTLNIVFIGYEPPHHCKIPENRTKNDTIPYRVENEQIVWDQCRMYVNLSLDNTTVPCTNGWTYYSDGYTTIVTEVTYQCCCLAADILLSFPVDRFGRKSIHIVSTISIAVSASAMAFSVNLPMFMALRFITGFISVGCLLSGITLIMELFDSDKRTFAGIGLEGPWLMAYLPMALFGWLLTDWRHLQFSLSIVNIVWIMYIWILLESVPWLVVSGKLKQASKVLNTMAKWNGVKLKTPASLSYVTDNQVDEKSEALMGSSTDVKLPKKQEFRDVTLKDAKELFTHPVLRKHTLVSMCLWLANCFVYYEIILISPMLPGDRFLMFFIIAVVEVPANILSIIVVKRYGRRIPTCLFHIAAGLPLLCVVFVPVETASGVDLSPVSITLIIMGKFNITCSFAIMVLYTKELFPTNLRGTSCGVSNVAGRIGNIVAPLMAYATKTKLFWLPSVLCAVISITVGLLVLILPETKNKPLPQTIDDVVKLYEKPKPRDESGAHDVMMRKKT